MKATVCGIEFVMCDCLVDQGFSIGGDPVGYRCTRPSKLRRGGFDLCEVCEGILEETPERVAFPQKNGSE